MISSRFTVRLACAAIFSLWGGSAIADNHAFIMSIGTYANPRANLPGIDLDVDNAVIIAKTMGVPESNIVILKDVQVSESGVAAAFEKMDQKLSRGDNLFIYYTGHGTQMPAKGGGAKCTEGMVTHDMKVFRDSQIERALAGLSQKAGQLVFMNDSCFSGGQAEFKSADFRNMNDVVPKSFKLYASVADTPDYSCGNAINAKMTRTLIPEATKKGANMLYVAAAQDNEVAAATGKGSAATLAWLTCLIPESDSNRSGSLSGEEIRACAQKYLDKNRHNQHIALVGNKDLPLSFVGAGARPDAPVAAAATLQDIRNGASPEIRVALQVAKPRMKIEQDMLDFSVTVSKPGYLTILQVGSDNRTFNRIFPNDHDKNDYVQAGTLRLPRPSWALRAGGPAGISHLMAVVSDTPRDFAQGMKTEGIFRSGNDPKTLYAAATGTTSGDPGRYGASEVVTIQEY